ncbi:MAG: Lpg1974 family pore-forming outer membrane protein [Gemmatales bacterium]
MLKRYAQALAAVALACVGGAAYADQPAVSTHVTSCATDCCNDSCGSFYGSAGVLFLRACGNGNSAYSSFDCMYENARPISHITNVTDFDNGIDLGYRFEFGYSGANGWGGRVRYFQFNSADTQSAIDNLDDERAGSGVTSRKDTLRPLGLGLLSFGTDINPTSVSYSNTIQIRTIDIELTKSGRCGCLDWTGSLGLRYLQTYQTYNYDEALLTSPATREFDVFGFDITRAEQSQQLRSGHSFNGLGPILGLEGRYTLWDSLRVYGLGRVGFIFSDGHQEAFTRVNFDQAILDERQDPRANPTLASADSRYSKMITTYEVEVGLEYAYQLCSGSELYLRGGVVGMQFSGLGNSSRSAVGASPGESMYDNFSLFGLTATVGFRY